MVLKVCISDNCNKPYGTRGLCPAHYIKLIRSGQLPPPRTVQERFWAKVDKSGSCWTWTAARNSKGYGQILNSGQRQYVHRYSYTIHIGEIPDGHVIDHKCHNRLCVNPSHLRAVTPKQNEENRAGASKASKSGIRGVFWSKKHQKWVAEVGHNNKKYFAGHFNTAAEAEVAVIAKRNELHTHNDLDRVS